jgi:hypothetical protein
MVTVSDYSADAVNAGLGVLVEVMHVLGSYSEHIVLAGGWVPYFLFPDARPAHCGSTDIDLALDFAAISTDVYSTILERLQEKGYTPDKKSPAKFWRSWKDTSGKVIDVRVDFIAGEYGGTGKKHRHQQIQDVRAQKARGCDLAFEECTAFRIEARMPDGCMNEVEVLIAGIVPLIVMKGMALSDREKEKDAYDIAFVVRSFPGGPEQLAEEFKPFLGNPLVTEALQKIRSKFKDIDYWGPQSVARFELIDAGEDWELEVRDVFERLDAFLKACGQ